MLERVLSRLIRGDLVSLGSVGRLVELTKRVDCLPGEQVHAVPAPVLGRLGPPGEDRFVKHRVGKCSGTVY